MGKICNPLEFLLTGAAKHPRSPALIFPDKSYTYAQLLRVVQGCAQHFHAGGVQPGMKVVIHSEDDFEIITSNMALWGIGAIAIPMNVTLKPNYLRKIEAIFSPEMGLFGESGKETAPGDIPTLCIDHTSGTQDIRPQTDPDALVMVLFTSGTSGVPKAVPIRNRMIYANARLTAERLNLKADDRILVNTPAYTTSSLLHVLTLMSVGGSIVIDRSFSLGATILEQIRDYGCTGFGGVPVHFRRIAGALESNSTAPTLRFLMNSGEHLPAPVIQIIRSHMPDVKIHCVYGLTEVSGRLCTLPPEQIEHKIGSVGFPLEGMRVTVRDDQGRELPAGQIGEIYVNGPYLMTGYLNNPIANAEAMSEYGFATGDLGHKDNEGYLFISGRNDDVLKVGGEKVSLNMIEQVVHSHNVFKDFAVAPYEDQHMGLVPALFYVLRDDADRAWRKKLIPLLREKLPKTYIPTHFIEVAEIPRTSSGKSNRQELFQLYSFKES